MYCVGNGEEFDYFYQEFITPGRVFRVLKAFYAFFVSLNMAKYFRII